MGRKAFLCLHGHGVCVWLLNPSPVSMAGMVAALSALLCMPWHGVSHSHGDLMTILAVCVLLSLPPHLLTCCKGIQHVVRSDDIDFLLPFSVCSSYLPTP